MKRRPWSTIVLVTALALSVVVNFFLGGYAFKQFRDGVGFRPGAAVEELVRPYPKEVRKEFRRLLRENRREAFAALRELRQARRALADAASATPYAQADVEQALARVRTATDALQSMMQGLLLEALGNTRQSV